MPDHRWPSGHEDFGARSQVGLETGDGTEADHGIGSLEQLD